MYRGEFVAMLQLDDEAVPDDEVGFVSSDDEAVLVHNGERDLRLDKNAFLLKPVFKSVFVDFFKISCAEVQVQCIGRLPDGGDKFLYWDFVGGIPALLGQYR